VRDCVVVGCGRSGTSMRAGLLATAGYDLGGRLLEPTPANPRGYFEDRDVMAVNESLLAPYTSQVPWVPGVGALHRRPLAPGERWLSVLSPDTDVAVAPEVAARMAELRPASPYCRKDPRFTYTLRAWDSVLGGAVRLVVFREPDRTARSICAMTDPSTLGLSYTGALALWAAAFRRVLAERDRGGEWLLLHYDQVADGTGLARLERVLGAWPDRSFCEPGLRRSRPGGEVTGPVRQVYEQLCALAGHDPAVPRGRDGWLRDPVGRVRRGWPRRRR